MSWSDFLNYLNGLLPPDAEHYPHLAALLLLNQERSVKDQDQINREIKEQFESIKKILTNQNQIKTLNEKWQAWQTGSLKDEEFSGFLAKFGVLPVELKELAEKHVRLTETKGPVFFQEMQNYLSEIKEVIFTSKEEISLNEISETLALIEKLLNLELSSAEWKILGASNLPSVSQPEISSFSNEVREFKNELLRKDSLIPQFYEFSKERDRVFQGQIKKLFKTQPDQLQIGMIVTGGFHADAMQEQAAHEGVSYIQIYPDIQKNLIKLTVMLGKIIFVREIMLKR